MGYPSAPGDAYDRLFALIRELQLRLSELERPDGSQVQSILTKLQEAIDGLIGATNVSVPGYVAAGGYGSFGGDIVMGGNLYTPSGRATPVVTSYVTAYLNSDGRLGATPSGLQFKQDVAPRTYTLADCRLFLTVQFRLIAAVTLLGDAADVEVGFIAQQLLEAGFPEFVACDEEGTPITVHYERMVVVAIGGLQEAADRLDGIEARLDAAGL